MNEKVDIKENNTYTYNKTKSWQDKQTKDDWLLEKDERELKHVQVRSLDSEGSTNNKSLSQFLSL